jgi:hypothetical protein
MLFVETGDVRRAVYVLQGATRLYQEDAGAQFDLRSCWAIWVGTQKKSRHTGVPLSWDRILFPHI